MPNPRLATRYAKALIDLVIEKNTLEEVYADMQWLQAVCKGSRDFVNVLRSPIIKTDKKQKVITAIAKDKVGKVTMAFLMLMTHKGRESNLPEIITAFIRQYKEHKKIYTVKLATASPLTEELKESFLKKIRDTSDMEHIELETTVNSELIGGFVLQAGDKLVDASIAYDLRVITKEFENNDFIYKIR